MRLLEVLKIIRNKFIRKKLQTQPEDSQGVPEKIAEKAEKQPRKKQDEREKLIRRYRAYAYCHKKRRIRKKYLKKLFEASPVDRLFYIMRETGYTAEELSNTMNKLAKMALLKQECGWEKDHTDSRTRGGVR